MPAPPQIPLVNQSAGVVKCSEHFDKIRSAGTSSGDDIEASQSVGFMSDADAAAQAGKRTVQLPANSHNEDGKYQRYPV